MKRDSVTIYIVDDELSVRTALERLLRSAGYHTLTFESAEDFLVSGPCGREGCLLLDIRLPGISGLELQDKLASQGTDCPVILMTAHDNPKWEERARRAGAVAYLKKPFHEDLLLHAIETACGRRKKAS
jgi:two-component system, LuxR family, response regulator FixJ